MTYTPEDELPEGVLEEKILGMLDASGQPTDDEDDAEVIRVQREYDDGRTETLTISRAPAPA